MAEKTKEEVQAADELKVRTESWMLVLREINNYVRKEMRAEFGVDVGFKNIDSQMVLSYVAQTALQRVKQRTKGKAERELTKKMKQILIEKGIKF